MQIFGRRNLALIGSALALALMAGPGIARANDDEPTYENAGLGAASALSSLIYGPVKVAMAVSGLVVGGLSYPLSGGDSQVMMAVINHSVRGDYVITPSHLRGEQPVQFWGRSPEEATAYGQAPEESGYQSPPAEVSAGADGFGS